MKYCASGFLLILHFYSFSNNLEQQAEFVLQNGHSSPVTSIAISPDEMTLTAGCVDKTIKIWEMGSGRLIRVLEGHSDGKGLY